MSFRRIFLAVPAPGEIKDLQVCLIEGNAHLQKIKWMRSHNLHLTFYFIGNVPTGRFDEVVQALNPLVSGQKRFSLIFDSLCLSPTEKPRMIWAKYRHSEAFSGFAASVHLALSGLIPQNRFYYKNPVPHITLARFHAVKNISGMNLDAANGFFAKKRLPEISVCSCELWETVTVDGRSDYCSVSSFPFCT